LIAVGAEFFRTSPETTGNKLRLTNGNELNFVRDKLNYVIVKVSWDNSRDRGVYTSWEYVRQMPSAKRSV